MIKMRQFKIILILAVILMVTTSCQQAVKGFVEGGGTNTNTSPSVIVPLTTSPSNHVIKMSPGSTYGTGTQVEGQVTITERQLKISGAQVDAKLGINITRTY